MKVGLLQVASPPSERMEDRLERVGRLVAEREDCDLVVLPELWPSGYFSFDDYERLAEPLDGKTVRTAGEWASKLGAYLHMGSFLEALPDGGVANTAVLLDPSGEVAHVYRKIHVFGYQSREAQLLQPGSDIDVVSTPFGRVTASTCYDLRFPELYRAMVDAGAQILIVPAAWPAARVHHWRLFTSVRAVEEQMLVIACNAAGVQGDGIELGGTSRVVDPWGEVLVEAGTGEQTLLADVDPGIVDAVRREFPVLGDRRLPLVPAERSEQ